ncbi:MAG: hypothetical protein [Cressdnaviricota sp.]|nr:MAG: hypothetical protein [Cressdnaviricota sp.]
MIRLRKLSSATCSNSFRRTLKCRRKCCKRPALKPAEPAPSNIARLDRYCSMCKRKYYASGVQCLISVRNPNARPFNCLPIW